MNKYDIVRTPKGSLAIVIEAEYNASYKDGRIEIAIDFIDGNKHREKMAWWNSKELKMVKSFRDWSK